MQGRSGIVFFLPGIGQRQFINFYECSAQLERFMHDHDNWPTGRPILEPEPACPQVSFNPAAFTTDPLFKYWLCPPFPKDYFDESAASLEDRVFVIGFYIY